MLAIFYKTEGTNSEIQIVNDMANFLSKKRRYFLLFSAYLFIVSCAPSRYVKPLEHKQLAVSGSFGGPMATIPGIATIPLPFTSLGVGYGLKPKTTVYANWYSTASVFGVIQFDAGLTQGIWKNESATMGISISPSINFFSDIFEHNTRVYPQLDANYYFDYWHKEKESTKGKQKLKTNNFYIGFTNWFDLKNVKAHNQPQTNHLVFCPQIGHNFERNQWNYTLEAKFLAPYKSNQDIVLDYVSPFGKRGALGIYFGITYKLKR
jgi:hypothetical protein